MDTGKGMLKAQAHRAFRSKNWRYALIVFIAVLSAAFIQTCLGFWGHDVAELPSAAYAWAGNHGAMQTPVFGLFVYFLMIPCSSAAFADRLYLDVRQKQANAIVSRASLRAYVASIAAIAFAFAFLLTFLALVISQLMTLAAFPLVAGQDSFAEFNTPASYEAVVAPAAGVDLLASLAANNRYAFNLLIAFYEALWSGIAALVSVAISLYSKRSRILVLGLPTLLLLVSSNFLPSEVNVMATYLGLSFVWGGGATLFWLIALPVLAMLAAVAAIAVALLTKRDVLL